ncbi:MAG TPA: STAS domain-containing protein [Rhizomicrobium sp.]|nr:STAS domain-containing protein [Rhizomicrobium sp.]
MPNRTAIARTDLPSGVEVFRLNGPFFFAAAAEFEDLLLRSGGLPRVLILRMAGVPMMDATGAAALKRFIKVSASKRTAIVLCELAPEPASVLHNLDVVVPNVTTFAEAVSFARQLLAGS